ncbi:MAG: PilW family protein [Solirubrobacterales bacterium]
MSGRERIIRATDAARDERGTTLVELTVAMVAATAVLFALTTVTIVTVHSTAHVGARVDATQNARMVLSRVVDELHSSCVAPEVAPVQTGSTGTSLRLVHGSGSEAAPIPTLSVFGLNGSTLSQTDYPATGGSQPRWTFGSTPTSSVQLMTGVSPIPPSTSIFTYYAYASGSISEVPLPTPLSEADAARTVSVTVALNVMPSAGRVSGAESPAHIRDSATFRLTPPSFNKEVLNPPCK